MQTGGKQVGQHCYADKNKGVQHGRNQRTIFLRRIFAQELTHFNFNPYCTLVIGNTKAIVATLTKTKELCRVRVNAPKQTK